MGFCISLCTVHTTQGQGRGIIVFYCTHPVPCPGPVQCEQAITEAFRIDVLKFERNEFQQKYSKWDAIAVSVKKNMDTEMQFSTPTEIRNKNQINKYDRFLYR